jgi:hypothetical protein
MSSLTNEHYHLLLKALPVNDIQLLLTYAGQSRTGKRQELLEQCSNLIKTSKIIREKCEELYNKRFGQGDLPTIPYPRDLKNLSKTIHQQHLNLDIHFLPLTFNEELCIISQSYPIPPVKQMPNGAQALVNFYFLLTAQQASGLKIKLILRKKIFYFFRCSYIRIF